MRYYLKDPTSGDIKGPFTVEKLNSMIAQGAIDSGFLATSDLGESITQLKRQADRDWFSLGKISNVAGISTPQQTQGSKFSAELKIAIALLTIAILALFLWWLMKAGAASGLSDS